MGRIFMVQNNQFSVTSYLSSKSYKITACQNYLDSEMNQNYAKMDKLKKGNKFNIM
jgi:hypothetical protein